jgi:lipid-A-disaccharide synthase-like uncharacterized protein
MWQELVTKLDFWAAFGLVAQLAFTARFVVQWLASERAGKSVMPLAFWYLSLGGSTGLLVYAVARADPIFILGQSLGSIIYLRNLTLIYRERRASAGDAEAGGRD